MAKIDKLKEELSVLKEEYKNLFILLLATLTGTFTSFYHVLIGKAKLYVLIVSALGFIASIFLAILIKKIRIKKIRIKMDKNIKELEEL